MRSSATLIPPTILTNKKHDHQRANRIKASAGKGVLIANDNTQTGTGLSGIANRKPFFIKTIDNQYLKNI